MNCKLCESRNSFELFDESFDKTQSITKLYICTNCFVLYNPTIHFNNKAEQSFEAYQGEVVSTYYKVKDEDIIAVNKEALARKPILTFLLDNYPSIQRRTLVDIGTGSGYLALAGTDLFDKVYATDLDISQAQKCIKISGKTNIEAIQNFEAINDTFDVAVLWHTMEHLFNPGQFIDSLMVKMNKGGVLFCQVPLYKKQYLEDCHVWFYNAATIKRIKEIFGFADYKVYFDHSFEFMTFLLFV